MDDSKLNLNHASAEDLAELPGIGKKLAAKIVAHREKNGPFPLLADLSTVPGVSGKMVDDLRSHLAVTAEPGNESAEGLEEADRKRPIDEKTMNKKPNLPKELRDAARAGDIVQVTRLLAEGANGKDKFALIWAAQGGHAQIVDRLIQAGADVNLTTAINGTSALALAAQNGYADVVETLIKAGAAVDGAVVEGWTPLMKAAYFGHREIVEMLLESGADASIRDKRNRTALSHAQRADNSLIVALLR